VCATSAGRKNFNLSRRAERLIKSGRYPDERWFRGSFGFGKRSRAAAERTQLEDTGSSTPTGLFRQLADGGNIPGRFQPRGHVPATRTLITPQVVPPWFFLTVSRAGSYPNRALRGAAGVVCQVLFRGSRLRAMARRSIDLCNTVRD